MRLGRSYGVFLCPNVQFFRNFSCNFADIQKTSCHTFSTASTFFMICYSFAIFYAHCSIWTDTLTFHASGTFFLIR